MAGIRRYLEVGLIDLMSRMTMACYGSAVWHLASLVPASKRRQAEKMVAGSFPLLELPWDGEEHEHSGFNVADEMEETMREELLHLWEDVRAIDDVVESVAVEFDGEDPLRPVMRAVVETDPPPSDCLARAAVVGRTSGASGARPGNNRPGAYLLRERQEAHGGLVMREPRRDIQR